MNDLLNQLTVREIPDELRHKFLMRGDVAFGALEGLVSSADASPRVTANALRVLREFCIWVDDERRSIVFKHALDHCVNESSEIRAAAASCLIGLCRTNRVSPSALPLDESLVSSVPQSLRLAVELGVDGSVEQYVKWFLSHPA